MASVQDLQGMVLRPQHSPQSRDGGEPSRASLMTSLPVYNRIVSSLGGEFSLDKALKDPPSPLLTYSSVAQVDAVCE